MIHRLRSLLTLPFRSFWISVLIFTALVSFTAWRIIAANHARRARLNPPTAQAPSAPRAQQTPAGSAREADAVPTLNTGKAPDAITETGSPFLKLVLPDEPEKPNVAPVIPRKIREQMLTQPAPIALGTYKPTAKPEPKVAAPVYYLPSFRRIPCMLVNALETGSTEIPIIALVVEDQYNIDKDGVSRLVIPAGVEVHGVGQQSPMRDRIIGQGSWTFVWRTRDRNNSRELRIAALALNRDYDERTKIFGATDGSPGLVGEKLQVNDDNEIKSLALRFVAATTRALQSQRETLNPLTNAIVATPKATVGNALMEGASATLDGVTAQMDKMRETLTKDGLYVAVLPGKQFYLYTKEPIDLAKATGPAASAAADPAPPPAQLSSLAAAAALSLKP